ncbi:MAG TPA: hypothetical protein VIL47_07115 [Candidatus Bipolaricaulota bacterium]
MTRFFKTAALCVLVGCLAWTAQGQDAPILALQGATAQPLSTVTLDLVLASAPHGLQQYAFKVEVMDPTIASFAGVEGVALSGPLFQLTQSSATGAEFRALDLQDAVQPGAQNVVLAHLSFNALAPGTSQISLQAIAFVDDRGTKVEPQVQGSTLTVAPAGTEIPPTQPSAPATALQLAVVRANVEDVAVVDLTLLQAPAGLERFDLRLRLSPAGLGRFAGVQSVALPADHVLVSESDEEVRLRGADLGDAIRPGASGLVLARIQVKGIAPGVVEVGIIVELFTDDDGQPITPSLMPGRIEFFQGPAALEPGLNPPKDLDGDGKFEDVNGDGAFDAQDSVVLAFNLDNPAVLGGVPFFDFDGDGQITFADAIALSDRL